MVRLGKNLGAQLLNGPALITKTITFTAAGTGLQGASTTIFTVTGEVLVESVSGFCTTSLEESAGTPALILGVVGSTAQFISSTTATAIDANEFWVDATPDAFAIALPAKVKEILITANIACEVGGSNNISAGVIRFDLWWRALSPNGLVVPA